MTTGYLDGDLCGPEKQVNNSNYLIVNPVSG
jgi:hypothetical protein